VKKSESPVGRPSRDRVVKYPEISERIQSLMARRGITRKDMATALGCSEATFGNYYNGWREPPVKYADKIANMLYITIGYLLYGKEDEAPIIMEVPTSIDPFDGFTDQEKNLLRKAFLKLIDLLKS
jgi:transcriptional regulator with XRE-family HTH domain